MHQVLKQLLWGMLLFGLVRAQTGVVSGTIKDADTGLTLKNVIIKLENSDLSTKTNNSGGYELSNISEGDHYLVFIAKGFYSLVIPDIKVKPNSNTLLNIEMYAGDEQEFLFLEIGGIHVTANRELLAQEAETVQRISSGELEHMQANSLADVLSMIPGNERTTNMGLQKQQPLVLRNFTNEADDQAALFGTKIIVDDVPLTNNADLQTGVGVGLGTKVQTTSGKQYDLREVVAENLEKVEVHSGASSVEYGDHSQGIVLVKTKTSNVPTRLKIRMNPDTRETNFMSGFSAFNTDFVGNLNYGYSEGNIRISGDEFHRISARFKAGNKFMQNRFRLTQNLSYDHKIDEYDVPTDPHGKKAYNRDHHFLYSFQMEYDLNPVTQWYLRSYIDYKKRNSWKHQLEVTDLAYSTDRMEPGTREGIFIDPIYESDVRTLGDEWSYGAKLKLNNKFMTGDVLHRLLAGIEFQVDKNTGQGKNFDMLKPPSGNLFERPWPAHKIPGTAQWALFFEDRITGQFMFPYTVNLGFRVDSYNPQGINLGGSADNSDIFLAKQGTFFNPRLGIKIKPLPKTQIRFNFSKSSKSPAMRHIYPAPFYLDTYDFAPKTDPVTPGDTTITLVTTYLYDKAVPNLKGYQSTKWEIALDHQIGDVGLSLLGYLQKTNGIPKSLTIPYMYNRYFWPDWPQDTNKEVLESVTTTRSNYKKLQNLGWTEGSGIEFTLRTHRIHPLNMIFNMNAAFNFKRYGSDPYHAFGNARTINAGDPLPDGEVAPEDMQVIPYYSPYGRWRQKMVINYIIDYVAKPLGIWFRLTAQQVLLERYLQAENPKLAADGYYYQGDLYPVDAQGSEIMGFDRSFDELAVEVDDSKDHSKWLFGVVVSKSLWKGAEISFFVHNIFNDRAYYISRYTNNYATRNPEIFWGVTFSSKLDDIF